MKIFFTCYAHTLSKIKPIKNSLIKTIIFCILFTSASIYDELNESFNQTVLDYKSNISLNIDSLASIKALYYIYNINDTKYTDEFIRKILFRTKPNDGFNKISMLVLNRNLYKLYTNEGKLLVMDLAFKCIDKNEDIFFENIFVINDIKKLSETKLNEVVLDKIKKMNYCVSIIFFDEFSIVNHHLYGTWLFKDNECYIEHPKSVVFYHLISNSMQISEYINRVLDIDMSENPVYTNSVIGFSYQITKKDTNYVLISYLIIHNCFLLPKEQYFLSNDKLVLTEYQSEVINEDIYRKQKNRDDPNKTVIQFLEKIQAQEHDSLEDDQSGQVKKNIYISLYITHQLNHDANPLKKNIFCNYIKEKIPSTNLYHITIAFYEPIINNETELSFSQELISGPFVYVVDENDIISNSNNYLKYEKNKQDSLDIIKRIKLNLNKYYQPRLFYKSTFYLNNRNWCDNECILLQGKRALYFTDLNDSGLIYINNKMSLLKYKLKEKENSYIDDFLYNVNPCYHDNIQECVEDFQNKNDFFVNLSVTKEFKKIQRLAKLKGLIYFINGTYYINNYYLCLIPYATLNKKFFNEKKAIECFNKKIKTYWALNIHNISKYNEEIFVAIMGDSLIQDIAKNITNYSHLNIHNLFKVTDPLIEVVYIKLINKLNFNENQEIRKSDMTSEKNIRTKEKAAEILLRCIKEMIDELYQCVYDLKTPVFINAEFDYIENEFDAIVRECKNSFPAIVIQEENE